MSADNHAPSVSKKARVIGHIMSALPALMFLFSASMKFIQHPAFMEGMVHLGIPVAHGVGLGILELTCTAIYLIPRTSVLGAILLTGYLGGATAIHVRVGDPFFATVILGVLIWGGLFLRDPRLRALIPFRK